MTRSVLFNISVILILLLAVSPILAASGSESVSGGSSSENSADPSICPPPELLVYDSTIYLCQIEEVCFPVVATDSMSSPLMITQVIGPGQFEMLTDSSGQTCFMPDSLDSATYAFCYIVERVSASEPVGDETPVDPSCCADTITITVVLNRPPVVTMAEDFSIYLCQPESTCFLAYIDDPDQPGLGIDSIAVNYGSYNPVTNSFCFLADTAGVYTLILIAVDTCDELDSDTTIVTVGLNSSPKVTCRGDDTMFVCDLSEICLEGFTCFDPDDNLITCAVSNGTLTDGTVCFMPVVGANTITLVATDDCDESDTCQTTIYVVLNSPPTASCPGDDTLSGCNLSEVCLDGFVCDDIDGNLVSCEVWPGVLNGSTVCFTPVPGANTITLVATDACGESDTCRTTIYAVGSNPPVVTGMPDSTLYLCYPQQICLPVDVYDFDNDIVSITVSPINATYDTGYVCFVPYDSGRYDIIVTAVDSCGNVAADTATVIIETDLGVELDCPNDTTIFTCNLVDTFCLPIGGIPESAEVITWGINTWYNAEDSTICFWSECSNSNHITVFVVTPCDTFSCEFTVHIECNNPPLVFLPPDTTLSFCEATEVCVPVGISDQDGNLDTVIVEGGTYNPLTDRVCFTADTAGTYVIRVTAYDSCEVSDWDQIAVTVVPNNPPWVSITAPDTVISQCAPEEICLPVTAGDADGNLDSVYVLGGVYDPLTGEVCFTPDSAGTYCLQAIAVDICGVADTASACVTVETGDYVLIDCPAEPYSIELCGPEEICLQLRVTGANYQISTSPLGSWNNDTLCFYADTAGHYVIEVIGTAECNSDTCYVIYDVTFSEPVSVVCPGDTSLSLCESTTLCLELITSASVDSVIVSSPAYIDGDSICLSLTEPAIYQIEVIGYGECRTDTCYFTVSVTFNSPPTVTAGNDTSMTLCELGEICVDFVAADIDTNIVDITASINGTPGVVSAGQVCFTPTEFGSYEVIITVVDDCGAYDTDTVLITISPGDFADIWLQSGTLTDTTCQPETTICITAVILPEDAVITILPNGYYDPNAGVICVTVDTGGTYPVTVIAEASCSSDTAEVTLELYQAQPPVIGCPDRIDTMFCLTQPVTLCYPVTVDGDWLQVSVGPVGNLSGDSVCLTVDTAGTYVIEIIAEGICGEDTAYTTIVVSEDQPPLLFLPDSRTIELCLEDSNVICIDSIYATDQESAVLLSMTCGTGEFQLIRDDSARICFTPDSIGTYWFCVSAFDDCNTTVDSFYVDVYERGDCNVCLTLTIEGPPCTPVGKLVQVNLTIETNDPIGGFNILFNYDSYSLQFLGSGITGTEIDGWEYYFHTEVTSGLVRLIGLADLNNGAFHPPPSTLSPNGVLVTMDFLVANDQNLGGFFLPIKFVWYGCGDNTFSDPSGDSLYMDLRIYSLEGMLVWDEVDDVNFPEGNRMFPEQGAPDYCLEGTDKNVPIRCIEFINGGICIIHPDSIDERGDINLNGVPYEIADAVVFTNYFIYGFAAFRISVDGQIAATDVNADGLTLTVGDLVYLIRVITGDAYPIGKLTPYEEALVLETDRYGSSIRITTEAVGTVGGALLEYDISGDLELGRPQLASDAGEMDLKYTIADGRLKLLIYDFGQGRIGSGVRELVEIPCQGEGQLTLRKAEFVDYFGRPYKLNDNGAELPTDFALNQNYPNPFNPATTISFALPSACQWRLDIFNITGCLVRQYQGSSEAGNVALEWDGLTSDGTRAASGVYLYRLEAADYSDCKKMILLK
ncbi:MAG: FlgD immunoglobulin-like domain containing protein [bacterium]